jgi:hypothetical protein
MKRRRVTSREYKVMMRPERFMGQEAQLLQAAADFWRDFSGAIADLVIETRGALGGVEKRRLIIFLDTGLRHLKDSGYIFRVRRDLKERRPEVTLKFRHGDRYLAEGRRMKSRRVDVDVKFEEDIKAPFVSLYSFSASGEVGKDQVPMDLDGLARLFPDIARRVDHFEPGQTLAPVGITARELVITGASLRIARGPKVETECALIVWYDAIGSLDAPVAVEFSYRYGSKSERYGSQASRRALTVFQALQGLESWIDPHPLTKTELMYQ